MLAINEDTGFTANNVKDVRAEINKALEVLKSFGIEANIGNISYDKGEVEQNLS